MKISIPISGYSYDRKVNDSKAKLRIKCIGEYAVEVFIGTSNAANAKTRIEPGQFADFAMRAIKLNIGTWGNGSMVSLFKLYPDGVEDACNPDGYADPAEIVDPDNRIGQLFQNKLNTGVLYGNEGMAKTASAGFKTLSKATILVRFARKNTTRTRREYICNIGDGETVNTGISVILTENNKLYLPFRLKKTDGTDLSTGIVTSDISGYLDGKMHSLAVCWAGTLAKLYIDGVLEESTSGITSGATIVASNVNISLAGRAASNTQFFLGQVSDFRVLNFDASATDAPYTVDDYQAGKRLPPALCSTTAEQRALVSLENYTIARNSTTKLIKDASGNGNDATVSGGLAGDMDAGIAAFVEELKTQINQQA